MEKTLIVRVTEDQYAKLQMVSTHIKSTPDSVAERVLRAALTDGVWDLSMLKQTLEKASVTPSD